MGYRINITHRAVGYSIIVRIIITGVTDVVVVRVLLSGVRCRRTIVLPASRAETRVAQIIVRPPVQIYVWSANLAISGPSYATLREKLFELGYVS